LDRLRYDKDDAALRIKPIEEALAATQAILEKKQRVFTDLVPCAPMDGIVVSPAWKVRQELPDDQLSSWWGSPLEPENLGATLEPGTVFCSVGDPKYLEAVIVVDQKKIAFPKVGQRVELMLNEFPGILFEGTVHEIEGKEVSALDVQLCTRAGGEVPTMTQRDGTEKPSSSSYRVRMPLDNPDLSIKVGMTGSAKIHVDPQTLGMRVWRYVNDTFNFKL
jgi:putative peptide zinc metalloprotease protein